MAHTAQSNLIQADSRHLTIGVLLLVWVGLAPFTYGQSSRAGAIVGTLYDAQNGSAIPGAHVFLAYTQRGTVSGPNGQYELAAPQPGPYTLVVSMIGYETKRMPVTVVAGDTLSLPLSLNPAVYTMEGIQVAAEKDQAWLEHFDLFTSLFLGETPNAAQTEIINGHTLLFEKDAAGRLVAKAPEPIELVNKALGYRILFALHRFEYDVHEEILTYSGEPYFEFLDPELEEETGLWAFNREQTYLGSLRHLLRSLAQGATYDEGFMLYTKGSGRPVGSSELLEPMGQGDAFNLSMQGVLDVVYQRKPASRKKRRRLFGGGLVEEKSELVILSKDGFILNDGHYYPQEIMLVSGELGERRMADALPREYGLE